MITELGIADGPAPEVRADATDLYIDALIGAVGATTVSAWGRWRRRDRPRGCGRGRCQRPPSRAPPWGRACSPRLAGTWAGMVRPSISWISPQGAVCGSYGAIPETYGARGRTPPIGGTG